MDNGSTYARIRSWDEKQAIQFLIVCGNHKRNRENLRVHRLSKVSREFEDNFDHMRDFYHIPLQGGVAMV